MAAKAGMKTFYAALGAIALVGALLIARNMGGGAPLTLETAAPLTPVGSRGVETGGGLPGAIEVIEFSDFECPFCARFAVIQFPDIRQRLIETGRVRYRFVHFPLNHHTKAPYAHLAAACAAQQGRFWEVKQTLFQNQEQWVNSRRPESVVSDLAVRAGVDRGSFEACMSERQAWGAVLADKALGDSLGVNATPTFYVNGRQMATIPSADRLRAIVDSLLPVQAEQGPR